MKRDKLQSYALTGSIHTVAIKSQGIVEDVQEEVADCIKASTRHENGRSVTTSIINPNALCGDLMTFDECYTAMQTILAGAGIDDYSVIRADMRFDSYDLEHYREFSKLNRYLISALAVTYNVQNCYRSVNLFSQKQVSIAIKNRYFEVETMIKQQRVTARIRQRAGLRSGANFLKSKTYRRNLQKFGRSGLTRL